MAKFIRKVLKKDKHPQSEPYTCAVCGQYAVDKAVDYKENTKGDFVEAERKYYCGRHRIPGTITHRDGTVDPSDFESISDTEDYT